MKHAETITMFLMDGDPNGRVSCELSNWNGMAYKIPRIRIKDCGDRPDLASTGVYLLFGKIDEEKDQVYIGEAESVLERLNQQLAGKDFWHEAIVFVNKDKNLNKAHIKYLESRLHNIAKVANRYTVLNSIVPAQARLSESASAEMEKYIENVTMLVNTLGHKVFDEKRENQPNVKQAKFIINAASGANAQGEPASDGFVVFKGSKAAWTNAPSMTPNYLKYREKLISDRVLIQNQELYEFTDDFIFSSPSTAASIVLGRNANGLTEWKQSNGKTLKESETN